MGKVLAYTELDRPRPASTGRGPASSTEEDMTATGLLQRMQLPGLLKVASQFRCKRPTGAGSCGHVRQPA
jgi:hypothetical protein